MEYKKKTDEEILALAEEFQKESLFRANCHTFWFEGVALSAAEIWTEARELLPKLIKKYENTSTLIATYRSIYQRRYTSLFKQLPTAQEQLRKSVDVSSAVFEVMCLMCYHCLQSKEELKELLTFKEPSKQEGDILEGTPWSIDFEYISINNFLSCLEYYTFGTHEDSVILYKTDYAKKKEKVGIEFDYDYTGLLAITENYATVEAEDEQTREVKTEKQVEEQAEEVEPQTGNYVYDNLNVFYKVNNEDYERLKKAVALCSPKPKDYAYLMKACLSKKYIKEDLHKKAFLKDLITMGLLAEGKINDGSLGSAYNRELEKEEGFSQKLYRDLIIALKKPDDE